MEFPDYLQRVKERWKAKFLAISCWYGSRPPPSSLFIDTAAFDQGTKASTPRTLPPSILSFRPIFCPSILPWCFFTLFLSVFHLHVSYSASLLPQLIYLHWTFFSWNHNLTYCLVLHFTPQNALLTSHKFPILYCWLNLSPVLAQILPIWLFLTLAAWGRPSFAHFVDASSRVAESADQT